MSQVIKIGVLKVGCIGTLPLVEFLLDERAERTDIDVRVVGSGAKLGIFQCRDVTKLIIQQKPDLILLIGPAQTTGGPTEARKMLAEANIPLVIISDSPANRIRKELEESGFGYIIVDADSMIGARREFLDSTEMALYNADVITVLAITGVFKVVSESIDNIIGSLKRGEKPTLPHIRINKEIAVKAAGFKNPYAKAKAMAAYEIARRVTELNMEGCFKVNEKERYVPIIAAGHEMMREAAKLADEARELEKSNDSILRKPHYKNGSLGTKSALLEKPQLI